MRTGQFFILMTLITVAPKFGEDAALIFSVVTLLLAALAIAAGDF
jgi:hypothetical protein